MTNNSSKISYGVAMKVIFWLGVATLGGLRTTALEAANKQG